MKATIWLGLVVSELDKGFSSVTPFFKGASILIDSVILVE
jgi:hypothetical protein